MIYAKVTELSKQFMIYDAVKNTRKFILKGERKVGVKGYKAYEKGLKCRDFQYEEGKTYEMDSKPQICSKGFHFCENPLDVLNHYSLCDSEFTEVEAIGEIEKENDFERDSKIATNKIKIGAKLDLKGLINASFNFIFNSVKVEKIDKRKKGVIVKKGDYSKVATSGDSSKVATSGDSSKVATSGDSSKVATSGDSSKVATSGDSSKVATSGDYSKVATSGDSSKVATSGDYSKVATSGYYSQVATSGDSSKVATSGYYSQVATSGDYSKVATSGDYSKVATSGDSSKVATSGYYSQVAINGKYSIGASIGVNGIAKGIKGTWLVLAEYARNKKGYLYPKNVKAKKVDGKRIKEDTYYKLENGKFVEVEN